MLQPFEVDLLRQDLQQALKLLGQDEIDDARALMREHGFDPVDFEILQQADPLAADVSPVTGTVTTVRRSSGCSSTYGAGHGTSWLSLFDLDLKSGLFGRKDNSQL
jgi:hypothetical protein